MIERAALDFLIALPPHLRRKAVFPLGSPERLDWHYIPKERSGVALKEMDPRGKEAALNLLGAALSEKGYERSREIMQLERAVAEIEGDHATYDPQNYFFSVFGTPGNGAPWGWRVEGHHLSLSFTHAGDQIRVTPAFFGANPAHGTSVAPSEHLARDLMTRLPEAQKGVALIRIAAFDDIVSGPGREETLRTPKGLPLARMGEAERNLAMALFEFFAEALRPNLAARERELVREAGVEKVHFAWAGELAPRRPHYWRLHGPSLLLEYDNTQNEADHIHAVWHDVGRDFGRDLLKAHYEERKHGRRAIGARRVLE
jgi:hypothetical protein